MKLLCIVMSGTLWFIFVFSEAQRLAVWAIWGRAARCVKAGQMLARGEETQLKKLLASARSVILLLSLLTFCAISFAGPWRRGGWRDKVPHTGSYTVLIVMAA